MEEIEIDFSPGPMEKLLDYVIDNYVNVEGLCPNTGLTVKVLQCVKCNYDSNYGRSMPKYGCPNFRKVYLIRFLVSHTKQTCDLIEKTIIADLAKYPNLSAISLGGGPGVEALALITQLNNFDRKYELLFDNVDRESSWKPIYRDLVQTFLKWIDNVNINARFFELDIAEGISASKYDVVFIPWVLSEMGDEGRAKILGSARDVTRPNRYVVVTDRPQPDLVGVISSAIDEIHDWDLVDHNGKCVKHCGVHFPDDIQQRFRAQVQYSNAYWILKKS